MIRIVKQPAVLVITLLFLTLAGCAALNKYNQREAIRCNGDMVIHKNDSKLKLTAYFDMQQNKGMVSIMGQLIQQDDKPIPISLKVRYRYQHAGKGYVMHSEKTYLRQRTVESNAALKGFLPGFFFQENEELLLIFDKIAPATWLLHASNIPYLICEKNS